MLILLNAALWRLWWDEEVFFMDIGSASTEGEHRRLLSLLRGS
jgi:hypothetical protein